MPTCEMPPTLLLYCKYNHYFNTNNKTDDIFSYSNKKACRHGDRQAFS
nr:MAG TPA: hypothetical protein [Caudoviricetes sp.]DAN56892.1 MAG TPA: hypothetical protein [Caudoviricetes sp.]